MANWVDIVSLCVSILTAALVPGVYWLYKRWAGNRERVEAERRVAASQQARARRAEVESKRQEYEELKEVFSIHSALTQLDTFAALGRVQTGQSTTQPSPDRPSPNVDFEAAKLFLISLHFRTTSQFTRLQENVAVPQEIIDKIDEIQGEIARHFPVETRATQALFAEQRDRVQGHQKNPVVQQRILEIARTFAGGPVELDTVVEVAPEFKDLMATLRITRAGQGISFTLPGSDTSIWFAGNGKGVLPATVEHSADRALYRCSLRSQKRGSLLTQLQNLEGGPRIATALADGIRGLARDNANVCGCGEPLTFTDAAIHTKMEISA